MVIIILQVIASFVISFGYGIVLEAPKKFIIHASIIGALGRLLYIFLVDVNLSKAFATFSSAILISITAQILARVFKAPVTVFLIAGILPLVPGYEMYNVVFYFLKGSPDKVLSFLLGTFKMAGAIALAIFFIEAMFVVAKKIKEDYKKNKIKNRG